MASAQDLKETQYVHTLSAKECHYKAAGGEWKEPSEDHPMAELVEATTFEITGNIDLKSEWLKSFTYEFEISIGDGIPTIKGAEVGVTCTFRAPGYGGFRIIGSTEWSQISKMEPNTKTWIRSTFPVNFPFKTLRFQFHHNDPLRTVGGLTFYQAKIVEIARE